MPERNASDTRRDTASRLAESHPPALPSVVKTSNGLPTSSKVMVTYMLPCPVRTRSVTPATEVGRRRGARGDGASTTASAVWAESADSSLSDSAPVSRTCMDFEPSRYTVTALHPVSHASS